MILAHARNRHKAEIHVRAKGAGIVVVEESHDLMNSLNLAFDDLEKKIKKEREKFREKKRRGRPGAEGDRPAGRGRAPAREEDHPGRLLRRPSR